MCENAGALRGAGVLYRAAVEALVSQQGATDGPLFKRIENLRGSPVDELVDDFLHEARLLGNGSIDDGKHLVPPPRGRRRGRTCPGGHRAALRPA